MMNKKFRRGLCALLLAATAVVQPAGAQSLPDRPVRVFVNTAPGGLTDVMTRLVAQHMGEHLKQSVVVENKAGGDGLIGIRAVKAAPADGYTLLATAGTVALQMAVRQDPGYDLLKDFTGIGLIGRSPFLLVVAPTVPDKTFAEFITRAKAAPGKLSYASAGVGTAPHLAAERIVQQMGVKVMHVPYKGNGAAMPDVMAGRVDTILEAYGSSSGKLKSGQLRALGVTSTSRIPALPDVPTMAEQGVSGYSYYTWLCFLAPAGTPKAAVQRLSDAMRAALASKAIKDRFREDGMEAMEMSPDEFNQYLAKEVDLAQKAVVELGVPKQ
ncbi:tripartite tricarboxylate transporter substrate binding protein [Variovorax defluvii]|uniref:Tripartite tricarboxylate transporter substrate binding protein n=1 Tax=Variovorax defluvii TaxID=913761 RepID=A0ABP8HLF8_9BURK